MEDKFYDSIIESLSIADSYKIENMEDLSDSTSLETFNKWVELMGLVKEINEGITLSWPIKISQFKELFLIGNCVEYHEWIHSLELKMICRYSVFTLYHEKEGKFYDLLSIWKDTKGITHYNAFGRPFGHDEAHKKLTELKIQLPIKE